ncbi:MAG: carbamoyl-phosphate synthase small chain [Chitinophagales bacterium]|nr:MAG: carbamoyl-phosphate synthase small chain [Chitinophagales bacterium]
MHGSAVKVSPKAVLLLEDGTVYHGKAAGAIGTTAGEICFNTGMTGYQEVFTDPSYFGQILVMTADHIGNYGVKDNEVESDGIKIAGLVMKNFSGDVYSRPLASGSLQQYLQLNNVVAISDLDTRALVRHIRNKGAMNAIISSEIFDLDVLNQKLKQVPSMAGLELASRVSTPAPYFYGDASAHLKIAVLDLGIKKNILRCLAERGCYLQVFPAKTPFEKMKQWEPHGYFLSNGPGDPAAMPYAVETVKKILESGKPVFGICLGHQLLALAAGVSTYKMFNGHRGLNHPVKNLLTGHCEVTSQNHGFSVNMDDIKKSPHIELTHINLNDNTVAGIRLKNKKAFSVQYHPESSPGPIDSRYLFDEFVNMVKATVEVESV